MWDTANQYVNVGETSGLLSLILFMAGVIYCFKFLGKARRAAEQDRQNARFFWLFGVAMFSNLVAWFGISYYDQTQIYWYLILAMVIAVSAPGQYAEIPSVAEVPLRPAVKVWGQKPLAGELSFKERL